MRKTRHNPELLMKAELAKQLGMTAGIFSYRLAQGDIPNGDVTEGLKKYYSKQLAAKIIEQVKQWEVK